MCVPDDSEGGDSQSVCPPGSDYNSLLGTCDCYGETEIFDATNYECVDVKDALGDCSIGEFKNAQGGCTKCQTWPSYDTNTERCVVCTGPMPSDCLMCGTGYFLNDNNQCQACASGCNYCFDEFSCMECSPGYMNTYQWSEDGSSLNQVCRAKCFTGQLPSVSSFFDNNLKSIPSTVYYSYLFNNGILLNDEQNTTLYFPPGYLNYVQDATNFVPAVAVDWIRNIYDISTVPWKTEKGKVTYGGSLMTLQCEFCLTDCEDCGEGSLLLQDTHTCVFLENCPPLYVRDETKLRSCKPVSADDFFSFVVHLTESEPGVYRLDKLKPLQAQVFTSKPDDTTLVFLWAVTKVKNTKTKKEESIAYMKTLIDTNDQDTVKIPFEKLKPDLVITLCNRATFSGTTIENCIDIATKPSKDVLDITELNVPASAVTVTPDSGTSGSQVFTVVGDFTDTLEKQKTSDTYFDFSMNAYL